MCLCIAQCVRNIVGSSSSGQREEDDPECAERGSADSFDDSDDEPPDMTLTSKKLRELSAEKAERTAKQRDADRILFAKLAMQKKAALQRDAEKKARAKRKANTKTMGLPAVKKRKHKQDSASLTLRT